MKCVFSVLIAAIVLNTACSKMETRSNAPSSSPASSGAGASDASNNPPDDLVLEYRVREKLMANGIRDVRVKSVRGKVMLCGYAEDARQKDLAEAIAQVQSGVTEVDSQITVGKPPVNVNKPGGPRCDF